MYTRARARRDIRGLCANQMKVFHVRFVAMMRRDVFDILIIHIEAKSFARDRFAMGLGKVARLLLLMRLMGVDGFWIDARRVVWKCIYLLHAGVTVGEIASARWSILCEVCVSRNYNFTFSQFHCCTRN